MLMVVRAVMAITDGSGANAGDDDGDGGDVDDDRADEYEQGWPN